MDITKLALDAGGVFLPFRDSIWSWDFEPHHLRRFAELVAADQGCAECGVTSTDTSMTALYCVSCLEPFFKPVTEAAAKAELNKLAEWMMQRGYATGHGDTMEQLLDALSSEIANRNPAR
jgi:hypothetical protein